MRLPEISAYDGSRWLVALATGILAAASLLLLVVVRWDLDKHIAQGRHGSNCSERSL